MTAQHPAPGSRWRSKNPRARERSTVRYLENGRVWHQLACNPEGLLTGTYEEVFLAGYEPDESTAAPVAAHVEQPTPIANASTPIIDLVLADLRDPLVAADLRARAEVGRDRYGVYLQAHNGRDALRDAYEEALDLAMYLRQAAEEQDDALVRDVLLKRCMEAIGIARHLRHLMAVWSRR